MELSNKKGIQQIVWSLAALGLKEVVICPGSRNAPFAISFNRHPAFHCTSVRDERSAAFFALGKAIELNRPVAVVCSSGSASLNFAPAIVEAYYQRIPLIVITADRPKEWTDQGDGQTINQTDIYRNYIRRSYDLKGEAVSETELWFNRRCLSEGYLAATQSDKGPVHFNVPLQEPLYETEDVAITDPKIFLEERTERKLPLDTVEKLAIAINGFKKIMILVGQNPPDNKLQNLLEKLAAFNNVVILTESTANLHHPDFVENIDRCITNLANEQSFAPELLITLGDAVISKRIKKFLRNNQVQDHWNIHPFDAYKDTYQSLTKAIAMDAVVFLEQIFVFLKTSNASYRHDWLSLKSIKTKRHQDFCQQCGYSDFRVFDKIFAAVPANTHLQVSNSSAIRYAQLFDNRKFASVWSNRGTSGIDGCTSTVMGAASAAPEKDFLFITGDVAFHYDLNALWQEADIRNLKIIVINNGGGNIFRIIEGPDEISEREIFLETVMDSNISDIAAHYNWHYLKANDDESLEKSLVALFDKRNEKIILEIFTSAEKNPKVLKSYWAFLNGKK